MRLPNPGNGLPPPRSGTSPTDEDPTPNTEDRPSGSQHPALSPPLQGRSEHRPRLRAQSRQQQLPDPLRGVETLAEGSRPRLCAPAAEDAALTVGVVASPTSAAQRWRLQATRPDGSAVVTSRPYPSYEAADAALDFVGVLSVLAGDPAQAGRVITSTTPKRPGVRLQVAWGGVPPLPDRGPRHPRPQPRRARAVPRPLTGACAIRNGQAVQVVPAGSRLLNRLLGGWGRLVNDPKGVRAVSGGNWAARTFLEAEAGSP